ncbi:hypothetical protein GCM10009865_00970 [Aeromicrobium ponti]|uniref:Uncharacterized protein n=1 Tax=Cytobacillus oceanisediminis TaxID=665099 RepID=A0A562K553_9BACI|nr:hypothetical protein [Cytobacillus oceanisediminis]TWH90562.1 hypothetical protein IQ19_00005 [Cytobacillus oceanisediminis]
MFWKKKDPLKAEGIAWFSYSLMLPDKAEEDEDITVIGNLGIRNTGTETLSNPIICIRIKPPKNVRLGGKIGSVSHTALMIDGSNSEAWVYIDDDWKEKALESGEHWLKPYNSRLIETGMNLNFAYELRISSHAEETFSIVEGFFYCDEIKNGFSALNSISVNF